MNTENYYFSERLEQKLKTLSHFPLTLIEAPSGFGKTTAVREYLNTQMRDDARRYWYTCLGESVLSVWKGICDLFNPLDAMLLHKLKNMDITKVETFHEVKALLNSISFETQTFLVIDNFQWISQALPDMWIHFFSTFQMSNFHLIILTQHVQISQEFFFHNAKINTIDASHFIFDQECISKYFKASGVRLKESDLEQINKNAAGWVAAVRLHLITYKETGAYKKADDVSELIKYAIWFKCTPEEQDFLMSIALLDGFTTRQAAAMIARPVLPDKMIKLLEENAFIQYLPESALYSMHSLLQDFLKNEFYKTVDPKSQFKALKLAGEACLLTSNYQQSIHFFLQIEDYESLMALPQREDYFYYEKERYLIETLERMIKKCPKEVLFKYPMSMLTFAFQFILFGRYEVFAYLCDCIQGFFESAPEDSEDYLNQIRGEMAFIESFTAFNDVEKMVFYYKKAYALLGTASRFDLRGESWTFGSVSILYLFWNKVGALHWILECLDESLPYYTLLSQGHGTGGNIVMRAEALLLKGFDDEAEVLCHKALYLARNKKQMSVCVVAELVLARIAILRGDAEAYHLAHESISQYLEGYSADWEIRRLVELSFVTLASVLDLNDPLPFWLEQVDHYEQEMYPAIHPYAQILYAKHLLNNKRFSELVGLGPVFIEGAEEAHFVLPQIYQNIYLARVHELKGREDASKGFMKKALDLALADKVFMPFAENANGVLSLLERGGYEAYDRESIKELTALCQRQLRGTTRICHSLVKSKGLLTAREKEVAQLAKEGLAVKKIAECLYISDATVKTILKSVYSKLEVHSKIELSKVEF